MSIIRKPYGLVYNTDGSLCYTIRTDDVPFPGVKSIAVEEGTTNLIKNAKLGAFDPLNFTLSTFFGGGSGEAPSVIPEYLTNFDGFRYVVHVKIVGHGSGWYGSAIKRIQNIAVENDSFTSSIYAKINQMKFTHGGDCQAIDFRYYNSTTLLDISSTEIDYTSTTWKRYTTGFTAPANTTLQETRYMYFHSVGEGDIIDFYIAYPQVEKKSFATSFTDVTRPKGQHVRPIHFQNGSVISANIKHNSKSYMYLFGWHQNTANRLGLQVLSNAYRLEYDVAGTYYHSDSFGSEAITDWNHFVMIVLDQIVSVYINGTKHIEWALPHDAINAFDQLVFQNTTGTTYGTKLIANMTVGSYYDKKGNAVWTPAYIKKLYESHAPIKGGK